MADALLLRIARGDQTAVDECLEQYGSLLWSLARRFFPNTLEAEEAVQDICALLWQNAGLYDPGRSSESTYITWLARRRLIDRRQRSLPESAQQSLPARVGNRTGSTEVRDEAALAVRALSELREEQKHVLELSIYHGLTHEQIARNTNLPLDTVKSHICQALLQVRELLDTTRLNSTPLNSNRPINYSFGPQEESQ